MPDENSNENLKKLARKSKGAAGQSNINFSMQDVTKNRKKQVEIFVRSDQLKPGDCVGVGSCCKGYDFWICSLKAHVPSVVFILDWEDIQELTKRHGHYFETVMKVLYEYVENTIYKV